MKVYVYQQKDYSTLSEVRKAVDACFPKLPDETVLGLLGITIEERPDPAPVEPTPEQIAQQALEEAKRARADAVAKIVVTVDGLVFDGDETAQGRMARTIAAAVAKGADLTTEKRTWVLADNTVVEVTVAQLAHALELAGNEQTKLWTVPYQVSEDATE